MNDRCCPNCDAPLEYCVSCGTGFSRFEIDVPKRPDRPQWVQPSREDAVRAIRAADWWPVDAPHGLDGIAADAVLALFAQQPTVAEVARKAWARGYSDAMGDYEHGDPLPPNPYGESEAHRG